MKAHRTDGVSGFFGLVFLSIAAWWLVAHLMELTLPTVGWFVAGALILLGLVGLIGALRSNRSAPPGPPPATPDQTDTTRTPAGADSTSMASEAEVPAGSAESPPQAGEMPTAELPVAEQGWPTSADRADEDAGPK